MRKCCLVLAACVAVASVSGCSRILNRPYRSISPHLEQHTIPEDRDYQQVETYLGLKAALVQLIRQHSETGKIRFVNYTGDPKSDISRACFDIMREDPLGEYAVDYMSPEYTALISEASVTITYLPGRESDILRVGDVRGLVREIDEALKKFDNRLLREVGYFESDTDVGALVREAYYSRPEAAVGQPAVSIALYPESMSGRPTGRIVELGFTYPGTPEEMRARVTMADEALRLLLTDMPRDLKAPKRALWLFDKLCATVTFDKVAAQLVQEGKPTGVEDDLYSALVKGHAISDGFALAYKRMCDLADISCQLVTGMRGNIRYTWTVIQLDDGWYHVDPAADAVDGTHDWFLKTDEEMAPVALWNQSGVPQCDATQYTYETITQTPPAEQNIDVPALSAEESPAPEESPA